MLRAALYGRRLSGDDQPAGERPGVAEGDDLLLVAARVKASGLDVEPSGPSQVAVDIGGEVLWARIARGDLDRLDTQSIDALLASAKRLLPTADEGVPAAWDYIWDLVLANPGQIGADFQAAGRQGDRGPGGATRGDSWQRRRRLRRPGGRRASDGRARREQGPIYHRRRRHDPALHPHRGSLLHRTRVDLAWGEVPCGLLDRAGLSASAARWKGRSFRATRTSITTGSSATPTSANGSTWAR